MTDPAILQVIDSTLVLRTLGVATPDLIYAMDRGGRYTFVSDAGARALNLTPAEMLGRTYREVGLAIEREQEFAAEREAVMASGKANRREVTFPLPDGERTFDFVISPLCDDEGNSTGTIVISRDITIRTTAERELRDQLRFRGAIERSMAAGIVAISNTGRITYASPSFSKMVGWSEDELRAAEPPYPFWPPEDLADIEALFEEAKTGKLEARIELTLQRRNGERFPVTIERSSLVADDGSILGWLSVVIDASERQRFAAAVAESERRYRDLANAMPQIVWSARPDGTFDYFNDRWYDFTGFARGTPSGWDPILHPDDAERTRTMWKASLESGQPYDIEYRFRDRSGAYCWHLCRALPARDANGAIVRWYGTCTDVEELKRAQGELSERETVLQQQNVLLQTLLDVSEVMSAELDVNKLVQFITDAATQLAGAQFGAFFYNVVDKNGESYMLYTISGVPREAFSKFPMPRNTAIFAPTFSGAGIVRSEDIRNDPRYGKNEPYHGMPAGHLPVVSYLAVPVISKRGTVIGGLFFGHAEAGKFTEESERLVAGVAAQAAIAIDNARLIVDATQSAERVRREEERYRTLVTATSQIVWSAAPDGAFTAEVPAWSELTGQSAAEQSGFGWLDAVHPDDRDRVRDAWQESVRSGSPFNGEYRVRSSNGAYRWFAARGYALRDEDGQVREWIGAASDIDDRRRSEEATAFLADASVLLTSSLDPETILTRLAHLAVPRLADWCVIDVKQEEEPYRRLVHAFADGDKAEIVAELHRDHRIPAEHDPVVEVMSSGRPSIIEELTPELLDTMAGDEEHRALTRQLEPRSLIVVPIVAAGQVFGAITLVHASSGRRFSERDLPLIEDIAARVGVAVQNARLYMEAQAANRAKDEFLATLSHELRTPMTSILGWARMLRLGGLDDTMIGEAINAIERSSRAQAQLIDDILDVSRITLGKLRLAIEQLNLNEIVANAVEAVRPAANAKSVAVETELLRDALIVNGDPNRLQQVVWNLVNNAVKFTSAGGTVRVITGRNAVEATVQVVDSGEGIAAEFLPYIFERFRQADSTTTRRFGGLGLGLAIVKQISELHGGRVTVTSEGLGRGATFTVVIPIAAQNAAAPEAPMPELVLPRADLPDLSGIDILVVDDERQAQRLLTVVLEQAGATVRAVSTADEALGAIRRARPRLLISDIAMPDRDGFSLIEDIRNVLRISEQQMPAIAVTAFGRTEDRVRILAAGFQRYLMKPLDPSDLTRSVAEAVGRIGS
ncbi:MAG: domain S-box [Acidobacteria bacterium]|nr:domain S-box [Acidobacteriota bacterium]